MFPTAFVFSMARQLLTMGGTYLVAKGFADNGTAEALVGGVLAAGSVFWSYWHHTPDAPK
ncbi:MAG: hypothetical protein EBR82_44105 [Caulobacteraceae bacterium]|nr:hypothetical protein [Caulobacteraceae bacterium]